MEESELQIGKQIKNLMKKDDCNNSFVLSATGSKDHSKGIRFSLRVNKGHHKDQKIIMMNMGKSVLF